MRGQALRGPSLPLRDVDAPQLPLLHLEHVDDLPKDLWRCPARAFTQHRGARQRPRPAMRGPSAGGRTLQRGALPRCGADGLQALGVERVGRLFGDVRRRLHEADAHDLAAGPPRRQGVLGRAGGGRALRPGPLPRHRGLRVGRVAELVRLRAGPRHVRRGLQEARARDQDDAERRRAPLPAPEQGGGQSGGQLQGPARVLHRRRVGRLGRVGPVLRDVRPGHESAAPRAPGGGDVVREAGAGLRRRVPRLLRRLQQRPRLRLQRVVWSLAVLGKLPWQPHPHAARHCERDRHREALCRGDGEDGAVQPCRRPARALQLRGPRPEGEWAQGLRHDGVVRVVRVLGDLRPRVPDPRPRRQDQPDFRGQILPVIDQGAGILPRGRLLLPGPRRLRVGLLD
mmetsp:Transcript_15514/g.46481  ORF Transcript_15514/g.46481 Transcript_15514/m.46481 type:complete len:398 (+) Transcript_15514:1354-2547(+)